MYGHRHGHVHLAFQVDLPTCLALLLELAAPTAALLLVPLVLGKSKNYGATFGG